MKTSFLRRPLGLTGCAAADAAKRASREFVILLSRLIYVQAHQIRGKSKERGHEMVKVILFLVSLLPYGCIEVNAATPTDKIDSKVIDTIRTSGTARVLVSVDIPINTSEKLRPDERKAQSQKISSAQDALLKELAGREYKLIRKLDNVPVLVMEIGHDALVVLEHSPLVSRVYLPVKTYPLMEEVVPHKAE